MNSPTIRIPRSKTSLFCSIIFTGALLVISASAAPDSTTTSAAFEPTQYPTIKVRHIPSTNAARALLLPKPSDRKTNLVTKKGTTAKGGDIVVTDDSYLVREVAPPLKPTAVIVTKSAGSNSAVLTQPSQAVK